MLAIEHTKRENNTWADDLTNQKTQGWSEELQYRPILDSDYFLCLDWLLGEQGVDEAKYKRKREQQEVPASSRQRRAED